MSIAGIGTTTPLAPPVTAPAARPAAGGFSTAAAGANAGAASSSSAQNAAQLAQQQQTGGGGHGGGGHGSKGMHAIANIAARSSVRIEKRKTAAERQAEIDRMQAELDAAGDDGEGDVTDERDKQPEA